MSHEIFGDRFYGREVPAWHSLGKVFPKDRKIGIREAAVEADCLYELVKVPVGDISAYGVNVPTGQFAVIRAPMSGDGARFLGFVGKDYELVDNGTICDIFEPLVGQYPLDTMFVLRHGDSFGFTLKIGTTMLNGSDQVDRYWFVNGNHANHRGTCVVETAVRVVCSNTCEMALAQDNVLSLVHHEGAATDLAVASSLMAKLHDADDSVVHTLEKLALARVTDEQVDRIIRAAYPDPIEPRKARFAREATEKGFGDEATRFNDAVKYYLRDVSIAKTHRDQALKCYGRLNDQFPDIAATAWAAVNCVTEVENHRGGKSEAGVDEAVLVGGRRTTMARALDTAKSIADHLLS